MTVSRRAILLMVFALAVFPFAVSLGGGFVWDDHALIEKNEELLARPQRSLTEAFRLGGEQTPYFRPAVIFSFALDHALWGLKPVGYRLTNLLAYGLTAVLLFLVLSRLLSREAAALAAALFAVHPVHAESVAFVSGRSDLLAGLFLLVSLLWCFQAGSAAGRSQWHLAIGSAAALLLSLSAKEASAFLPALALALVVLPGQRPSDKARIPGIGAMALLGAAGLYLTVRQAALRGEAGSSAAFLLGDYPYYFEKVLTSLLLPFRTLPYYDTRPVGLPEGFAILFGYGLLFVGLAWLGRTRRWDFAFRLSALFFLFSLLPTLPFLRHQGAIIADRFLYIPSMGLAAIAGCLVDVMQKRKAASLKSLGIAATVAVLCLATWSGLRAAEWRSDRILFTSAVARSSDSGVLNYILGKDYLEAGDAGSAKAYFERSVIATPSFSKAWVGLADVHRIAGETAEAERIYRRALATEPRNSEALFGLGSICLDRGADGPALEYLGKAVEANPGFAAAYINIGSIYYARGDRHRAEESWRSALRADPRNALALNNLGVLARKAGRSAEARDNFLRALAINPAYENAQTNLRELESGAR